MMAFGDEVRDRSVALRSETKLEALTTASSLSSNVRENSRSVQVNRASKPSLPHAAGACLGSFLRCVKPRNSNGSRSENAHEWAPMSLESSVEPTCPMWKMNPKRSRSCAASMARAISAHGKERARVCGFNTRGSRKLAFS